MPYYAEIWTRSPIFYALKGSRNYPKHDLLRLFLNYGADPTLVDGFGWDAVTASLLETSNRVQPCDAEQGKQYIFVSISQVITF